METREEYSVAISPDPAPTLKQLEQRYAEYLEQGLEVYEDLALIVRMLGKETVFPRRAEPWLVYDNGNATAVYSVVTTNWSAGRGAWSIRESLTITIGQPIIYQIRETPVCWLSFQDGDLVYEEKTAFVPGRWLEEMLKDLPKARAIAGAHSRREYEAKRQALIERLLIGKEV
jgi:hypothetical protein